MQGLGLAQSITLVSRLEHTRGMKCYIKRGKESALAHCLFCMSHYILQIILWNVRVGTDHLNIFIKPTMFEGKARLGLAHPLFSMSQNILHFCVSDLLRGGTIFFFFLFFFKSTSFSYLDSYCAGFMYLYYASNKKEAAPTISFVFTFDITKIYGHCLTNSHFSIQVKSIKYCSRHSNTYTFHFVVILNISHSEPCNSITIVWKTHQGALIIKKIAWETVFLEKTWCSDAGRK